MAQIVLTEDKIDERIARKIYQLNEKLFLDNDDALLAALRHFNWEKGLLEERWFDDIENLRVQIGLDFNDKLPTEHPEMNASLAANNDNLCQIIYDDFDEDDPEMKPMQLVCGHQFSAVAWTEHLQ